MSFENEKGVAAIDVISRNIYHQCGLRIVLSRTRQGIELMFLGIRLGDQDVFIIRL